MRPSRARVKTGTVTCVVCRASHAMQSARAASAVTASRSACAQRCALQAASRKRCRSRKTYRNPDQATHSHGPASLERIEEKAKTRYKSQAGVVRAVRRFLRRMGFRQTGGNYVLESVQ